MPNKKVLKYKYFIENDANEMGGGGDSRCSGSAFTFC